MRIRFGTSLPLLIILLLGFAEMAWGQPARRRMIYLEVSADARARVGTQQEWLKMLQGVGADKVYVSNLGNRGTGARLKRVLARV